MKYLIIHYGRRVRSMKDSSIDFSQYISHKQRLFDIDDEAFIQNFTQFIVSNNWFGIKPITTKGKIFITENDIARINDRIEYYCKTYNDSDDGMQEMIFDQLNIELPKTSSLFKRYARTMKLESKAVVRIGDFILSFLPGELEESSDNEISIFMNDAFNQLPHLYADIIAEFVNWTHEKKNTVYRNLYFVNEYFKNKNNSAYDPHSYLDILYHLYNQEYIESNDMYYQAAESKNYADTWLFLSMHFLCALRNSDLLRLPHPKLPKEPEVILEEIKSNTFSEVSAKATLYSVLWELEAFMQTPNKTKGTSGVGAIKIYVPESVETHIGTLFALAEAHFRLSGKDSDQSLLRIITKYEEISRYMGDEIGDLFLESDFRCRSANKSYMQMIYLLTDDILGVNDEFKVKGYMLAALARSHKGSYGEFAKTTSIYLKDAKMSGYTPDFVAKELFERGVLSTIPSMLLKTILGNKYTDMSVSSQTKLIQGLNLSPLEIENSVSIMQQNLKQANEIVKVLYSEHTKGEIIEILHKIGNGEATSKKDSCMCLMTAMGKACPFLGRSNCVACEYEISTKSTMFLMAHEAYRLQKLYKGTDNIVEKIRYKALVKDIVIPSMEEMLMVMNDIYGPESVKTLEEIIMESKYE